VTLTVVVAAFGLPLAACGGGGDDTAATTTTVVAAATTTLAPTTTLPPTTTTTVPVVQFVTDGAVVAVANASGINGAAGRLTDRLAVAGYEMTTATNSSDAVSNIQVTKIYFDPSVEAAEAVAQSLKVTLGGGSIEVLEIEIPAPTESGDLGDASVLVLMGNDVADRSLEELQGLVAATTVAESTSG
jgi:hypothetical protein